MGNMENLEEDLLLNKKDLEEDIQDNKKNLEEDLLLNKKDLEKDVLVNKKDLEEDVPCNKENLEEDVLVNKILLYSLAKSFERGSIYSETMVKDGAGDLLFGPTEIVHRWKQYFESLLNVQHSIPSMTDTEEEIANDMPSFTNVNDISIEEVKKVGKHMQNHKSPGCDKLPA